MEQLAARGADAIILGCAGITQLIDPQDLPSLPLLDSTALRVEAIVNAGLDSAAPRART
ncbi:hypothetical protein [Kitasatospora sp. NPDC059327]|uniref:hypothetical protein n=1 Tax=Kitasatospora sp. NPDC059327 TaxID=3346803 RepID=UPI003676B5BF